MSWTKRDWEKKIRALAVNSGNVIWTEHAKQQMRRRNISMAVALDALCHGVIRREPEVDIRTAHTVCRMERYAAGKTVGICVALEAESSQSGIVVTAMLIGD